MAGSRTTVAGVDEAGRGPLAGPVVAAAVVLDLSLEWDGLDDSKQLTAAKREALYARVLQGARAFRWCVVGPRAIDRDNIRRATLYAMSRSVRGLALKPELVLVDGKDTAPGLTCEQRAVVDGDATCLSIAAASILAKVVRDRIMTRLDRVWPVYGFAKHKGYGSPEHMAAIREHGPCPAHRMSFAPMNALELPLV
ncbi:MAG: ribonuclease HII [Candidatus Eisenbacteria bacterium]|uniref:Ribonuclease HII n=1 Tax=Eiseniibacteriota bacterium TaxID=2212470 RepID=A0A933SDU5_UNCEI|nr:ribonuclease HII [Candidatus Eisenbacteria bacterium]